MRSVCFVLALAIVAPAQAQVNLVVRGDGTKVISNLGAQGSKKSDLNWLAKQRNRRSQYDAIIDRYAVKHGVDPVLVRAVIQVESNFNPRCVSHKGARGLMQLMLGTAKRFGVRDIFDVEQNIQGGIRYLAVLLEMFPDDLSRALAAYNAGENAVIRNGGIPPYEETMTYVKRALTVYYGRPYGAVGFTGSRGGKKLKGGFKTAYGKPPLVAVVPGMRYLGSQ
jgi:soluble lytic murein transglycosylase-like protein